MFRRLVLLFCTTAVLAMSGAASGDPPTGDDNVAVGEPTNMEAVGVTETKLPSAAATSPATPEDAENIVVENPVDAGQKVYRAFESGDYWYAIGLVLCFLTWLLRTLTKHVTWFQKDRGGLIAIGVVTCFAVVGVSLVARAPPSGELFVSALAAMVAAMGGWTGMKRAFWPRE